MNLKGGHVMRKKIIDEAVEQMTDVIDAYAKANFVAGALAMYDLLQKDNTLNRECARKSVCLLSYMSTQQYLEEAKEVAE